MKISVEIDAPGFKAGWGREQQWLLTGLGKLLRLLASRIEFGQSEGTLSGDAGATLRWKIEQQADEAA